VGGGSILRMPVAPIDLSSTTTGDRRRCAHDALNEMTYLGVRTPLVMVAGLVVSTIDMHRCLGAHWVIIEGACHPADDYRGGLCA